MAVESALAFNNSCKILVQLAADHEPLVAKHKQKLFLAMSACPMAAIEHVGPKLYTYKDFILTGKIDDIFSNVNIDNEIPQDIMIENMDMINNLKRTYPTLQQEEKASIATLLHDMLKAYALYLLKS